MIVEAYNREHFIRFGRIDYKEVHKVFFLYKVFEGNFLSLCQKSFYLSPLYEKYGVFHKVIEITRFSLLEVIPTN